MQDKSDDLVVDKIDEKGYDYEMINVAYINRIWIKCK